VSFHGQGSGLLWPWHVVLCCLRGLQIEATENVRNSIVNRNCSHLTMEISEISATTISMDMSILTRRWFMSNGSEAVISFMWRRLPCVVTD
jgi:hypothetical protein